MNAFQAGWLFGCDLVIIISERNVSKNLDNFSGQQQAVRALKRFAVTFQMLRKHSFNKQEWTRLIQGMRSAIHSAKTLTITAQHVRAVKTCEHREQISFSA